MRRCTGSRVMSRPSNRIDAGVGAQQAGQHVEERGLARAVRADQAVQPVGMHIQMDVRGHDQRAEPLVQAAHCQDRLAGIQPVAPPPWNGSIAPGRGGMPRRVSVQSSRPHQAEQPGPACPRARRART